MQNELIIVSEYCRKCHIEPSFIDLLQEGGLIEVMTEGGEQSVETVPVRSFIPKKEGCLIDLRQPSLNIVIG